MKDNPFQKLDEILSERFDKPPANSFTLKQYAEHKGITDRAAERALSHPNCKKALESRKYLIKGRYVRHFWFREPARPVRGCPANAR